VYRRFHHQLGSTFWGVATVKTDRGTQFTSPLWTGACTSLGGIKHVLTTAYHPQSNGMVERVHTGRSRMPHVARSPSLGADGPACGA
jgi:transposase InsO family protein